MQRTLGDSSSPAGSSDDSADSADDSAASPGKRGDDPEGDADWNGSTADSATPSIPVAMGPTSTAGAPETSAPDTAPPSTDPPTTPAPASSAPTTAGTCHLPADLPTTDCGPHHSTAGDRGPRDPAAGTDGRIDRATGPRSGQRRTSQGGLPCGVIERPAERCGPQPQSRHVGQRLLLPHRAQRLPALGSRPGRRLQLPVDR